MEERLINLKDDKKTILKLSSQLTNNNSYQYIITAFDLNNDLVAECRFAIISNYIREIPYLQRSVIAKRTNKRIDDIPSITTKRVYLGQTHNYNISDNILTYNNKHYSFLDTICELYEIQIIDDNYYRTGLGTAMIKLTEEIALQYNASAIEAFFSPIGKFSLSSGEFYKRNNFVFISRDSLPFVRKELDVSGTSALLNN